MEEKYSKLLKNSLLISLGNMGSKILSILMVPLFTYILTTAEYGKIDIITSTISLLIPLISLNMIEAIFRYAFDKTYSKETVLNSSLVISILSFLIFICFYNIVDYLLDLNEYIIYFYILLLIQIIQSLFKQLIRALEKMYIYILSDVVNTFLFLVLNIYFLVVCNMGIKGYLFSLIIAYTIDMMLLLTFGKIYKLISLKSFKMTCAKLMIRFSLPLIPNALMWWIVNLSDRYIISYFLGYESNGIYSLATKVPTIITTFYLIFSKAWQISVLEEYEKKNFEKFYYDTFYFIANFLLIMGSGYLVFNKLLINLFISETFLDSWKYTPFLVLGAIFSALANFYGVIYIANKETRNALISTISAAIINIIFNLLFVPLFGVQAACISTAFAFFIMWIIRVFDIKKKKILINSLERKLFISLFLVVIQAFLNIKSIENGWMFNLPIFVVILMINFIYLRRTIKIFCNKFNLINKFGW